MANTKQAKKRARQSEIRRQRNVGQRSAMRTAVKKVMKLADSRDAAAVSTLSAAQTSLDQAVTKGLIHKNKAARLKSRLVKRVVKATRA
ncbi:MAG: 30S ribosomal protein S20 [Gammaproteobacteria bacterium RIFCSPHIGHO2_12_FULL_45_9]|nr:MAG: 30S ribosomal protein S20 [Gammaproteobacteria bacterium RIFCSPHIGHO2_12_FULL_45_9]